MAEKTNRLSICLIKDGFTAFEDIVPDLGGHIIEGVGTFYGQNSFDRQPDWAVDFFGGTLDERFSFRTASSKGVLLVEVEHGEEARIFALIFGHGRHLIADGAIEERFGLKVVLNSVERDNLRSIDKTALGAVPKQSREQMSREPLTETPRSPTSKGSVFTPFPPRTMSQSSRGTPTAVFMRRHNCPTACSF